MEIQALVAEINDGLFGVRISYPAPEQSSVIFVIYKDGKFHETQKFDFPKLAKGFLVTILNGEYKIDQTNDI